MTPDVSPRMFAVAVVILLLALAWFALVLARFLRDEEKAEAEAERFSRDEIERMVTGGGIRRAGGREP